MYFPRMLDKIRLFAAGKLREDFHANMGVGLDGFCCRFLQVDYSALREYVLTGASDEETLAWCQENGRHLTDTDAYVWSCFARKRGWRDPDLAPIFDKYKAEAGLADRTDIQTSFDFYDVDEGRELR